MFLTKNINSYFVKFKLFSSISIHKKQFRVIYNFVDDVMHSNDLSHNLEHVLRVCKNVEQILDNDEPHWDENNRSLTILTALCHECCDTKYVSDKKSSLEKLFNALKSADVSDDSINVICEVVPQLSFSSRLRNGVPLFSSAKTRRVYEIVSDADYLEALGITGIIRTNIFQGVRGNDVTTASHHIENTIYKCVDHLSSSWAKKEGAIRLECMKNAMEWYKREQNVSDLNSLK